MRIEYYGRCHQRSGERSSSCLIQTADFHGAIITPGGTIFLVSDTKLNREQLQAVNHASGPLLIIAGAGTGKTTVITERIKRLIADGLAEPQEILALTFTEKAAREMEERVDVALPYGFTQLWTMTFHSFCDRVLRDDGLHIGLNPDYKLILATDIVALLRTKLFDLDLNYFRPLGNPTKFISGLLQHFDRLRDEDVLPESYREWIGREYKDVGSDEQKLNREQYLELAKVYEYFQQSKIKANYLDFADLVLFTLKLFRTRPNILKKYREKFKYLLVDEYQDTNFAQNQLVNLLAGRERNLTVVADDDQSIYRWRGAAVSNVIDFRNTYPDAKIVVLTKNYRSGQKILDAAYKLIQNNNPDRLEVKEHIDKHLVSVSSFTGAAPEYLHSDRVENEADSVSQKIRELMASENYQSRDFSVLVRANAHALPFITSLSRFGIPYQFLGPGNLFDQPEIKDLLAYLNVIRDYTDTGSLFRVLSIAFFDLPVKDLVTVLNFAGKQNQPLFTVCEHLRDFNLPISETTLTRISRLVEIINRHISLIVKESAGQILFYFLQDTGMLKSILDYKLPIDEKIAGNINLFFNKLKSFESQNQDASIPAVLDWIDLSYEVGESPAAANADWTENNAVNILTVHSAKGLEFPVVFLANLVSQRFPTVEKKEQLPIPEALIKETLPVGDYHLEEERRLFYVGMTRAKNRLFLTASDFYGEGKRAKKISPFVFEALGENPPDANAAARKQMSLLDWDKPHFNSGQSRQIQKLPVKVDYLSYSQIRTFRDCPLHYKAKYIFKIASPPSAASSFGNTIHQTMKIYHENLRRGEKPDIQDIFSHCWTPEGYHNARHAQGYFNRGVEFLNQYLKSDMAKINPVLLEESFTIPLTDKIKIGGKIDRVNLLPGGDIEIVDYKTSPRQLTVKEAAVDLQLSYYALAATLLKTPIFNKTPDHVRLSLYYFENQQTVSVCQTVAQLEAARQEIISCADEIVGSDFRCSNSLICQGHCDYQILCGLDRN